MLVLNTIAMRFTSTKHLLVTETPEEQDLREGNFPKDTEVSFTRVLPSQLIMCAPSFRQQVSARQLELSDPQYHVQSALISRHVHVNIHLT